VAVRGGGAGGIASAEDPAYLGSGVVWVDATDLGNNRVQLDSMAMKGSGRDKTSKFHFDTNLRKLDLSERPRRLHGGQHRGRARVVVEDRLPREGIQPRPA